MGRLLHGACQRGVKRCCKDQVENETNMELQWKCKHEVESVNTGV